MGRGLRQSAQGSRRSWTFSGQVIWLLLVALTAAWSQKGDEDQGIDSGNYNLRQSVEFGYRFTDFTGNQATYDTFVNLQQGPRLLDMTLEMRSLNHQGLVFDRLYLSNFGYGGDPNNVSRLRIGKNKWYDFDATFRRDQNVWNYSLLANPRTQPAHSPMLRQALNPSSVLHRTYSIPDAGWATTTWSYCLSRRYASVSVIRAT